MWWVICKPEEGGSFSLQRWCCGSYQTDLSLIHHCNAIKWLSEQKDTTVNLAISEPKMRLHGHQLVIDHDFFCQKVSTNGGLFLRMANQRKHCMLTNGRRLQLVKQSLLCHSVILALLVLVGELFVDILVHE